jgi:hypothetical protein
VGDRATLDRVIDKIAIADFHVGDRATLDRAMDQRATADFHVGDRATLDRAMDQRATADFHVEDRATLARTTGESATAARRMGHETQPITAVASTTAGNDAKLMQLLCDAREALTTAGYKPHQARAAVEVAWTQVDDEVTLPLLIRKALQCCARARAG